MSTRVLVVLALVSSCALAGQPSLGVNTSFNGFRFFPSDSLWNKDISSSPTDLYSDTILQYFQTIYLHLDFGPGYGFPYTIVSGSQRKVSVISGSESDLQMFPIPPNAPIEGGGDGGNGDSHCLVYDRDNGLLYETFATTRMSGGRYFSASSCCIFNAKTNVLRPRYWTSGDAAGLPILPGLVRGDELVEQGAINHAIRFTVVNSRHAFVPPATHWASSKTGVQYPPLGCKFRLKASVDISWFPPQARVIAQTLKTYGMINADNGGDLYMSGAADNRYNANQLATLSGISGAAFEVVQMDGLITH